MLTSLSGLTHHGRTNQSSSFRKPNWKFDVAQPVPTSVLLRRTLVKQTFAAFAAGCLEPRVGPRTLDALGQCQSSGPLRSHRVCRRTMTGKEKYGYALILPSGLSDWLASAFHRNVGW